LYRAIGALGSRWSVCRACTAPTPSRMRRHGLEGHTPMEDKKRKSPATVATRFQRRWLLSIYARVWYLRLRRRHAKASPAAQTQTTHHRSQTRPGLPGRRCGLPDATSAWHCFGSAENPRWLASAVTFRPWSARGCGTGTFGYLSRSVARRFGARLRACRSSRAPMSSGFGQSSRGHARNGLPFQAPRHPVRNTRAARDDTSVSLTAALVC
jgi:hypothetical protein